jgi:hypothetical protein
MRHDGASGALDRIFAQSRWKISVSATPIATVKSRFPFPGTRRFDFLVLEPFIEL